MHCTGCPITKFSVRKIDTSILFKKDFIYLFLGRREGKEKERERNINVCLPLMCPLWGTWPKTRACALTGSRTSDPLLRRLALNPLSRTAMDYFHSSQSVIMLNKTKRLKTHYKKNIVSVNLMASVLSATSSVLIVLVS